MLTKLELRNFKSHRHTEFNFDDSRLQAIVGQNSSGKTSVLQALNYLSQLSIVKLAAYEKYDEYHDALTELAAEIGINNVTYLYKDLHISGSGFQENDEMPFYSLCKIFKENSKTWEIDRAWQAGNFFLEELGIEQSIKSRIEVDEDDLCLVNDLKAVFHLKLSISNLVSAGYSEEIVPEIESDGSGLAPTLDYLKNDYPERFQSLQDMLKQVVPSVRKVGTRRAKVDLDRQRLIEVDGQQIFVNDSQEIIGQEIVFDMATGDRIPASAISEGTMLTLGLLTVLMNPQQPNLVLLDDIEQGLHPKAQRELITVFKKIIQANPQLQIIFTTHSPYIIDELEPSQVHVLSNAKDGFTRTKRLDQHPDIEWAKQTLTTGEFWDAEGEDWVVEDSLDD
jgi:AAA15 family ATPase/GTPase